MSIQLACLVFLQSNFSILNLLRPPTSKLWLHVIVLLFKERNKRFQSNIVTYPKMSGVHKMVKVMLEISQHMLQDL